MIDPLMMQIAIALAKEIAAFVAREGKDPTDEEIQGKLFALAADNVKADAALAK